MSTSQSQSTEEEPNPKTISFSTLSEARKCGHFYRLKNVQKLYPNTDSIWTHYGKLTHKYVQAVLMDEIEPEVAAKKFIRTWFRFCQFWRKQLKQNIADGEFKLPHGVSKPRDLYPNPAKAILKIKDSFKKEFGEHKVLWIEHRLREETEFPQKFSGLIDIGVELEDGKIIIADFKTCSSHFMFHKYRDKWKDYQLTLYKHFFATQAELDPKKVETYFITIPKDPKVKKEIEFTRITSGKVKVENALTWLTDTLQKVQDDSFQKNRVACTKFFGKDCPFLNTEHCT